MEQEFIKHLASADYQLFAVVAGMLQVMAIITGSTYFAINIIVYYIVIPLSYVAYIGKKFVLPMAILCVVAIIGYRFIPNDYLATSKYFFDKSVEFLKYSGGLIGANYIQISVYICVYVALLPYLFIDLVKKRKKRLIVWGMLILVYAFYYLFVAERVFELVKPMIERYR